MELQGWPAEYLLPARGDLPSEAEDSFGISPPCGSVGVGSWAASGMYGAHSKGAGCRTVTAAHTDEENFLFESGRTLPGAFPAVRLLSKLRPQSHSRALPDAILITGVG